LTIHYHGTPITPIDALYELRGRHFCVSHAHPGDVKRCHEIGQSVMLDNGAFSQWKQGKATDWAAYYDWCERWLSYPETWAVIPDQIDGAEELQNELVKQWPFRDRGAPVWHMNETLTRLLWLVNNHGRVCIGSTSVYRVVLSDAWCRRMDDIFNTVMQHRARAPRLHMLRGMACSGKRWPFASVDSTDIARNHNRAQNTPRKMADRWDAIQCPGSWEPAPQQMELAS
jgi:hypothetical protein